MFAIPPFLSETKACVSKTWYACYTRLKLFEKDLCKWHFESYTNRCFGRSTHRSCINKRKPGKGINWIGIFRLITKELPAENKMWMGHKMNSPHISGESSGIVIALTSWQMSPWTQNNVWWRHQMETFSALLAICAGNSPVPGDFPAQRPVT